MSNERPWFQDKLDQDEAILKDKGVPEHYWGYILANGAPGTNQHDKLGAIYMKRKHLVKSILQAPENKLMGVTVIDGRDIDTIRKWIGGADWTQKEEKLWLESMKAKQSIEEWEAQGPYTFEKLLDWVVEKKDYDFCALLDRIAHKFPVDELDRVVGPRGRCPSEKYDRYCEATDGWTAIPTNGKFDDDQLSVLAWHNQIVTPVDVSVMLVDMNSERRLGMFKLMRDHYRDKSPKRK